MTRAPWNCSWLERRLEEDGWVVRSDPHSEFFKASKQVRRMRAVVLCCRNEAIEAYVCSAAYYNGRYWIIHREIERGFDMAYRTFQTFYGPIMELALRFGRKK